MIERRGGLQGVLVSEEVISLVDALLVGDGPVHEGLKLLERLFKMSGGYLVVLA